MSKVKFQSSNSKDAIKLYGENLRAVKSRDKTIILVGPAGSGKTFSLCLKMHLYCTKYPGVQVLLCRKTLPALRNTVVKTYQSVLELTGYKDKVRVLGETRPTEFIYQEDTQEWDGVVYSGVSRITLSQIDTQGKALGAEYDLIYVNQPDTEGLTEEEFSLLSTRARANNAPYRQIIADPNPANDQHWLLKGSLPQPETNEPKWELFNSTHKDNPDYYNYETEEWTLLGKEHLKQLELLPDHLKQSQLEGKWFSTEGTVFGTSFNTTKHILYYDTMKAVELGLSSVEENEETEELIFTKNNLQGWHNYLAIDWGGTDPFTALLVAQHPTDNFYVVHQHIYITETDIFEVSRMTKEMIEGYNIKAIIADRGRAESTVMEEALGYNITTAKKGNNSVSDTLNIMIGELNSDRWFFINTKESLFNTPDPKLLEKKKLMGVEELANLKKDGKSGGIAPKQADHYTDALRYLMRYLVDERSKVEYPSFIWL